MAITLKALKAHFEATLAKYAHLEAPSQEEIKALWEKINAADSYVTAMHAMRKYDILIHNHGIERINTADSLEEGSKNRRKQRIIYYSNSGETYQETLIWDHTNQKLLLTNWGDIVEYCTL